MARESYWTRRPTKAGVSPRSRRAASAPSSAADDAGDRAEDARLRARRADARRGRLLEQAAVAGPPARRDGQQLAAHARPRPRGRAAVRASTAASLARNLVGEVVRPVDDDVVAAPPARAALATSKRTACGSTSQRRESGARGRARTRRPSARRRRRPRTAPGGAGCSRRRDRRRRRRSGATPAAASASAAGHAEPARADDEDACCPCASFEVRVRREVALAGVAEDRDDRLARPSSRATSSAIFTDAPAEMPTSSPSRRASCQLGPLGVRPRRWCAPR